MPVSFKKKICAILTYHGVSLKPTKNCVTMMQFSEHIKYLKDHFNIISLPEMVEKLQAKKITEDSICITFDDAYVNVFENAVPELQKNNLNAAIFVPAGLINQYNKWDYDHNKVYDKLKIVNEEQLKSLERDGFILGSHTVNHTRLYSLDDQALRREIFDSKKFLDVILENPITLFAFAYGELTSFDERAVQYLKKAGYKAAFTTHFGRFNQNTNPYKTCRVSIRDKDTVEDLHSKLNGKYDWLKYKELLAYKIKRFI